VSLHPSQIEIAKKIFNPDVDEVKFAIAYPRSAATAPAVAMLDARCRTMRPEAGKVMVDLAKQVAAKDKAMAKAYGF